MCFCAVFSLFGVGDEVKMPPLLLPTLGNKNSLCSLANFLEFNWLDYGDSGDLSEY